MAPLHGHGVAGRIGQQTGANGHKSKDNHAISKKPVSPAS